MENTHYYGGSPTITPERRNNEATIAVSNETPRFVGGRTPSLMDICIATRLEFGSGAMTTHRRAHMCAGDEDEDGDESTSRFRREKSGNPSERDSKDLSGPSSRATAW